MAKQEGRVVFWRGGHEVSLYEAPTRIAVLFKDGSVTPRPGDRIAGMRLPATVRFLRCLPGRRIAVFHCARKDRDDIMDELRKAKDVVQYCSHVLQRRPDEDLPNADIGLDDKLFVKFRRSPTNKKIQAMEAEHGVRAIWRFPEMDDGIVFQLTQAATMNPIKISMAIGRERTVEHSEPCLIDIKSSKALPSDPAVQFQWHLLNTGQGLGAPGADCNAPAAWDHTWGDPNLTVALIDDGFDLGHPDFDVPGKIRAPYDATGRDPDPSPVGFQENHGTSCAGVAVASRGGGVSVGIAPDCGLMPIRHAGQLGDLDEALAFYHAYKNGADVISCSWGPYDAYQNAFWPMPMLTQYVVDICFNSGRNGRGIPIFFAAGNGNEPLALDGYASYENVIAVAASTNEDHKAGYSDYGRDVWVCAPSSGGTLGVFTTDRRGFAGYNQTSDYTSTFGGTSSSTPLVAGIAALMLSVNPTLSVEEIKEILRDTAVKINRDQSSSYTDFWGAQYSDAYDGRGHSPVYGWGRVDAGAAVAAAMRPPYA